MRIRFFSLFLLLTLAATSVFAQQAQRSIVVLTEPDAIVWIDDVKRGVTDETGKLVIKPVRLGNRKLRVRADGFKEITQTVPAAHKGELKITLVKTTDEAELTYQQAEKTAESDKEKSIELYRKAVKLRPKYAEAFLGMARAYLDLNKIKDAHEAVAAARKIRPIYPELTAVEGRIFRADFDEEKAISSFKRAIREGGGYQPEAFTGLAILYKEKAELAGGGGDFEQEKALFAEAAKNFSSAIEQLSGSEPVVYYMLGEIYEKQDRFAEAIKVYEQFIRDMPDSDEVSVMESFITQLKKKINREK